MHNNCCCTWLRARSSIDGDLCWLWQLWSWSFSCQLLLPFSDVQLVLLLEHSLMFLVLAVSAQRNSPTVLDLNKQPISLTKLVAICTKALLFLLWQQLTKLNRAQGSHRYYWRRNIWQVWACWVSDCPELYLIGCAWGFGGLLRLDCHHGHCDSTHCHCYSLRNKVHTHCLIVS